MQLPRCWPCANTSAAPPSPFSAISSTVIALQSAALSNRISQNTSFPTILMTNTWIYSGKQRKKLKKGLNSTIVLTLLIRIPRKCANKFIRNRVCPTSLRFCLTNPLLPTRGHQICSNGCLWCSASDTWLALRSSNSRRVMCRSWVSNRRQRLRRSSCCIGATKWATCTRAASLQGLGSAILKNWSRKATSKKKIKLYHSLHDYCPLYFSMHAINRTKPQ